MDKRKTFSVFATIFLTEISFLISGCSKAPEHEMAEARRMLHEAMIIGAEEYAPSKLKEALDALGETRSKIENKDYKTAKEVAILAKQKAIDAKRIAIQVKKSKELLNKKEIVRDE